MTKKLTTLAALAIMAVPAGTIQAQEADWVHVRVDEAEATTVRLNLPVSMVAVALEAAREEAFGETSLSVGSEGEITLDDIREMWQAMRDAGDAEFVNVQDGDEHIRVFRRDDRIYVEADEGDVEAVRIEMPVEIADALLGEEGDQLDLESAIRELALQGESDLVQITSPDATVRVWVDGDSDQEE